MGWIFMIFPRFFSVGKCGLVQVDAPSFAGEIRPRHGFGAGQWWNLRTNLVELVAGKSRIQTWWHGVAFSLCQSCRRCFRRHGCVQKRRMGFPNIHIWQILVSRCIKTLIFSKFSSPNCRRSFGVLVADPPLFCCLRSWLQLISGCSLANASLLLSFSIASKKRKGSLDRDPARCWGWSLWSWDFQWMHVVWYMIYMIYMIYIYIWYIYIWYIWLYDYMIIYIYSWKKVVLEGDSFCF